VGVEPASPQAVTVSELAVSGRGLIIRWLYLQFFPPKVGMSACNSQQALWILWRRSVLPSRHHAAGFSNHKLGSVRLEPHLGGHLSAPFLRGWIDRVFHFPLHAVCQELGFSVLP
jgi:hypothetical protein